MRKLALFFGIFCLCIPVTAEINMGWSVEGLTVKADIVASGTIFSIDSTAKTKGGDRLLTCGMKVTKWFKGEEKTDTIYFGANQHYTINTFYQMKEKEVMVFLETTIQAMMFKGNNFNKWALQNVWGNDPLVIDMEKINKQIFCASTFKLVKDKYELEQTINYTLQQLEKYLRNHKKEEIKIQFLETPWDSEAHRVLDSGSACFLYVPHFLFPKSETRDK